MIETGLALLLAVHLLLVNLAMGGPLVCLWLEVRFTRHGDAAAGLVGRTLARDSLTALAAAIALGALMLAVLWLRGDTRYFQALGVIPQSRLWFSLAELVFYFVVQGVYLWRWDRPRARWLHRTLAVLAATDLMLHFPPLFVIIAALTRAAGPLTETLDRQAFYELLLDPQTVSRVLHVWLSSLAVAGAVVMIYCLRLLKSHQVPAADTARLVAGGARVALSATLLQLPVGVWVLVELPSPSRERLLGGDLPGTLVFGVSLVAAFGLLHHLAAAALGDVEPAQVRRTCGLMTLVVVLMTWVMARADRREMPPSLPDASTVPAQIRQV